MEASRHPQQSKAMARHRTPWQESHMVATGQPLWADVTTLLGLRGAPAGIPRTLSQLVGHWLGQPLPVRLCAFDASFGTCSEVSRDDPHLTAILHPKAEQESRGV